MSSKLMMMGGVLVVGGLLVAGAAGATRIVCDGDCETPTPTPSVSPSLELSPTSVQEEERPNPPGDEQDCETSTNVDACGGGYTNAQPETPEPIGQVKGVEVKATPTPTPTPEAKELKVLPKTGANVLLPLVLAGSWLAVAAAGFRKKW